MVAPLAQATLGVALAGAAVEGTRVLSKYPAPKVIAVAVLVLGSIWFASTRRTSLVLALLMLYLGLLDGYLKLASGSSVVTLIRDALLYSIVIGLMLRGQIEAKRFEMPPLSGWVLAYIAVVLVQIANPHGGTLFHSLAGVRQHLEFVPLFFLGYWFVTDLASLRRFVVLLLVIGAANGVVGFVQFNLSPAHLATWGPGYAKLVNGTGVSGRVFNDVATGVTRVRPLGLGSDAGDGGLFGVLALGGVLALIALPGSLRYRVGAAILGVGVVIAVITSEGRGVIIAAVATLLAFGIMTATSQRRLANLAGIAVAGLIGYLVVTAIVAGAGGGGAFRYQGLSASKILTTATSTGGRPAELHIVSSEIAAYPLGAGLATAGPASGTPGGSSLSDKLNAESEFAFLVLETGVPGLIALIGFTLALLGLGLIRCRREPDPHARLLLAALVSPIAGILVDFYAGPATVTVPDAPYLWFVGGVIAYWLVACYRERRMAPSVQA
jgi:hypothetical protein